MHIVHIAVTALVVASIAADSGENQNPDQPLTAASVVVEQIEAVVAAAAAVAAASGTVVVE